MQRPELRVDLLVVRHRWHDAGLQCLDRDDILDPHTHRVPGEALGVGHQHGIRSVAEDGAQRLDFGGRAAATRRRVGLMRHEHQLGSDLLTRDAPVTLGVRDEFLHHLGDVGDVESRAVEGTVRGHDTEHFTDRRNAPLPGGGSGLHDHGRGTHADQHAVTAPVERERRLLDDCVGGRRPGGEEARSHPLEHVVRRDIVGSDDHDTAATPGADPVLGDRHRLCRARAGCVQLGVWAARADQLGELRVTHGQDAEQEPAVELVGSARDRGRQRVNAVVDLRERVCSGGFRNVEPQRLELLQLLAPRTVALVGGDHAHQSVTPRKR